MKIVTGPDFPTGGFIYGGEELKQSYLTGRGIIQMRARAGIDRIGRGTGERDAIVITEIPFQVNKARLLERIAELINEKKLDGVSDLRDESDRTGMRIVVELKRDAVPQVVLNKLVQVDADAVVVWRHQSGDRKRAAARFEPEADARMLHRLSS